MTAPIRETAPAKLTLFLHVTGRRADGYHLLDGLLAFTALGDEVTLRPGAPGQGPSLTIDGPFAAALAGENASANLAVRAATELAERLGRRADIAIALTKTLPVAAGLGGGSADAAAVLRGLALLWDLPPDHAAPWQVAAALGSDVPACLCSHPARISGTGTELRVLPDLPVLDCLLVNPMRPISTPAVYRHLREAGLPPARPAPPDPPDRAETLLFEYLPATGNDLLPAAAALCPEIKTVLAALADPVPEPGWSGLAGSGASCVWLGPPGSAAGKARALRHAHPGWWIAETCLRPDTRYVRDRIGA